MNIFLFIFLFLLSSPVFSQTCFVPLDSDCGHRTLQTETRWCDYNITTEGDDLRVKVVGAGYRRSSIENSFYTSTDGGPFSLFIDKSTLPLYLICEAYDAPRDLYDLREVLSLGIAEDFNSTVGGQEISPVDFNIDRSYDTFDTSDLNIFAIAMIAVIAGFLGFYIVTFISNGKNNKNI